MGLGRTETERPGNELWAEGWRNAQSYIAETGWKRRGNVPRGPYLYPRGG